MNELGPKCSIKIYRWTIKLGVLQYCAYVEPVLHILYKRL